jgi:hypothetical protein
MPQYVLARHVFVCMQGEHVVFLDVRKDRYFALESARTAGLGHFVPGWPIPARVTVDYVQQASDSTASVAVLAEQLDRGALSGVLSLLLDKGILVVDADRGKLATATTSEPLSGDFTAEGLDDEPHVTTRLFLRFVAAAVRARLLLKYRTFETVVERVRLRGEGRIQQSIPDHEIHRLVGAFAKLRPFFFAARDACLFDALSLSEFLAGYGAFPNWVFGVQARPFAAHCWLQLGGIVLNDTVDHVKRYTPIMVV